MVDQVAFWNERAKLGEYAGTRDRILKRLEIEAIAKYIRDGMTVLDAGCGNGETALELYERCNHRIFIEGIDQSGRMIEAAIIKSPKDVIRAEEEWRPGPWFRVANLLDLVKVDGYDLIYTERVIINLPAWEEQLRAMRHLISLLKPGGLYVMCESCQDGLDRINALRTKLNLPAIAPPEHNRYIVGREIAEAVSAGLLPSFGQDDFTSTYYLLSRVVNAAIAADAGCEPNYESPINQLALELPPLVYGLGQTRIWTFRRPE